MTISRLPPTLALAALLAVPGLPSAQDVSQLAGLLNEPVVSTASKAAETAGLAPATTSVITSDDLRRYAFTTLDEAINFLGVGMLTERSWGTPEIGARGVLLTGDFGNHVLLLLDGHALNEPWDETAYYDQSAGIPLDMVDHVEVILGPGSVLYGSSAMLGVVNVITKRARDYSGLHLVADGGHPTMTHLAGGFGQELQWGGQTGELTVGLDVHQTWGPDATYGLQPYGSGAWGGDATHRSVGVPSAYLRFSLGDFQLALRAAQSTREATLIWGSFDDPSNWERDRFLSADARWSASVSSSLALSVRLYGDFYDYLQNTPTLDPAACFDPTATCLYQNSGTSRWAGTEVNATYDWLEDGRYVTLLGVDARYRHVSSWSTYQSAATGDTALVAPFTKSGGTLGAYVEQTARPASWLSLNVGFRLDADAQLGAHLSPRLAAVSPAWSGGTIKAIYAEAFRAPSFYERYYTDNVTQLAAPDLLPEKVRSLEAVVEQRLGASRLRLSAFRAWWSDMVLLVDAPQAQIDAAIVAGALPPGTTSAQVYANASRVDSQGVEAAWDATALGQRLRWGAAITVARARRDGQELAAAAQAFGNAHLSYDLGGRLPTLALAVLVVGPRPVSGTNVSPAPDSSSLFSLRGAITGALTGGLSYRLAGTWSSTQSTAYAVGPARDQPDQLLQAPRWQALVGLRYDR
ncbi:MAG TPA: TonB-dependent receptor [Anaeromyxobacter sp.]|nr:TonB-dependent receptor [Anaeromyxobacter sp.]